jgi:alpha-beta hydrolase superfamily lysophospholipase
MLRLDLYGHASMRQGPNVRYDLDLFANQVLRVLEHCSGDPSRGKRNNYIIGIGHSMGSVILAGAAASIVRPHNRFQSIP